MAKSGKTDRHGPATLYRDPDLATLSPEIDKLMELAGTDRFAVGVYHAGKEQWCCGTRYPNQAGRSGQKTTKHTIFPIYSLTQLFTAITVARWLKHISQDNNVTWNTCLEDVQPKTTFRDKKLHRKVRIVDLLSHNSGMTRSGCYRGAATSMLIHEKDYQAFINDQAAYRPEETNFYTNHLGYMHAGRILERNCRMSWSYLVRKNILDKWEMSNTFTGYPRTLNPMLDIAESYHITAESYEVVTHVKVPPTSAGRSTSFSAASDGMYSCGADLLKAYVQVMKAMQGRSDASPVVTDLVDELVEPRTAIGNGYGDSCLGLIRVVLPGRLGYGGLNRDLMPGELMPVIGQESKATTVYYHQGSGTGGLAAMAIVPAVDVAVVVLSNTVGHNDGTDWVLQLVLSSMLGGPPGYGPYNLIRRSEITMNNGVKWYWDFIHKLANGSGRSSGFKSLESCVGTYRNSGGYFEVQVSVEKGELFWTKQGLESEKFRLYHYEGHTFHWLGKRTEMVARGIWVPQPENHWLVTFRVDEEGEVNGLTWLHDPHNPAEGEFLRVYQA